MGQDDAPGTFRLDGDDLRLDWQQPIINHPTFAKADQLCRRTLTELATACSARLLSHLPSSK